MSPWHLWGTYFIKFKFSCFSFKKRHLWDTSFETMALKSTDKKKIHSKEEAKMYVLVDIEWVTNKNHHISPTQIAALRVDESWYCDTLFYTRIKPKNSSFHLWDDIAYSGGDLQSFLNAPGLYAVMSNFVNWIRKTDTICVWNETIKDTLINVYQRIFHSDFPYDILLLNEYTEAYVRQLNLSENTSYIIAQETGEYVEDSEGYAVHEAYTIRNALRGLGITPQVLEVAPSQAYLNLGLEPDFYLDEQHHTVHTPECPHRPDLLTPIFYPEDSFFFQSDLTYCSCTKSTIRGIQQTRNREKIDALDCPYIYLENSKVFHRASCSMILSAKSSILGAGHYQTALATGRRPCRTCKPDPDATPQQTPSSAPTKRISIENQSRKKHFEEPDTERQLTKAEIRSLKRFHQAQQERYSHAPEEFQSKTEQEDFYTLSCSGYGFFAAKGHSTFHLRNCWKLNGLAHIRGFATYKEAVCRRLTPCRFCKPSAKHDILYPAHIDSKIQENESTEVLVTRCQQNGYPYQQTDDKFLFETPVGRWMIHTDASPYVVYHINLVMTPNNHTGYHRQPRLFLSLLDTFRYIQKHDKALAASIQHTDCNQDSMNQSQAP